MMSNLKKTQGSILLTVIVVMFILAIGVAALMLYTGTGITQVKAAKNSMKAFYITEAGLQIGIKTMADDFKYTPDGESPSWADNVLYTSNGSTAISGNGGLSEYPDYTVIIPETAYGDGTYQVSIASVPGSTSQVWLKSEGECRGMTRTVVTKLRIKNISPWNNAIFAGEGAEGKQINGNVSIAGSVHLLGGALDLDGDDDGDIDGDDDDDGDHDGDIDGDDDDGDHDGDDDDDDDGGNGHGNCHGNGHGNDDGDDDGGGNGHGNGNGNGNGHGNGNGNDDGDDDGGGGNGHGNNDGDHDGNCCHGHGNDDGDHDGDDDGDNDSDDDGNDDGDDAGLAMDISGSATIQNNYNDMPSSLYERVPSIEKMIGGSMTEDLETEVRIKHGKLGLSGSAKVGTSDGIGYKGSVLGTYVSDGWGGNKGAANVISDNGATKSYDCGDSIEFPKLTDPYEGYATYIDYIRANALVINDPADLATLASVTPETNFSASSPQGSFSIDGNGNLHVSGIVLIDGPLGFSGKNKDVIEYTGKAAILTTGNITMNVDLLTKWYDTYPVDDLIGFMTPGEINFTKSQLDVMGLFYAEDKITSEKQTDVAGTFFSNYFDMGSNVPAIFQVPETVNNLPEGLIGAENRYVMTQDVWAER